MSIFQDLLQDKVYEVLGLPDPVKYPDPNIPGMEEPSLGSPTTVWLRTNKIMLGIIGVILLLVIVLTTTKKRKG